MAFIVPCVPGKGENQMAENTESDYINRPLEIAGHHNVNRLGFLSLVLMGFLLNYVESMVIPSIPDLQTVFKSSTSISSWLVSAFLISATVAAPLFGKLGDRFGKKRMLMIAFLVYSIGVGSAGFAPSMGLLIVSRAFQGVGFGGIVLAFAILVDMFPRERLSGAQGIMSGMFATGGVAGLVAGSYIISVSGWQWAFHSAFILSLALMAALILFVKDNGTTVRERIDFTGAFSLTLGLTLILLYVTEGSSNGWLTATNIVMLTFGLAMIGAFLWHESRSSDPLLHLELLSDRNIRVANLIGIFAMAMMQVMFLAIVYFSDDPRPFGEGFDSIRTGLILAPGAIVMAGYGPFIGRIINRTGPKPILALGGALLGSGMAVFLLFRTDLMGLIATGILSWMGMISMFVPSMNMIALGLPPERRSIGMGMNMMLRNMGGAIGPAVAASLMTVYSKPVYPAGAPGTLVSLPEPMAFNMLMVVGFILAAIVMLLNIGTRNYKFGKPSISEAPA